MNIFGNAQKYTKTGYIAVQLTIGHAVDPLAAGVGGDVLTLRIRDSGRGMSSEFMERRLYRPFSQEDSFSPGVGLGLSIV
jgi:signal transduction histidine kinase